MQLMVLAMVIVLIILFSLIFLVKLLGLSKKCRLWSCKHLSWHKPVKEWGFDGCSLTSICRDCGKKILRDSQGNWF